MTTPHQGRRPAVTTDDGVELFVDDRGPVDAPALLYVHGGPGQGCWDFMRTQGDRLAAGPLRVVGVDQRGCLRSGDLPTEAISQADLVADYETVRTALGIDRWMVLGHSAGGPTVLEYAAAHPRSVTSVVLDSAVVNGDATSRHRMTGLAALLEERGHPEPAERARELATRADGCIDPDEVGDVMRQLGADYMRQFFHDDDGFTTWAAVMEQCELDESARRRGRSHLPLVADGQRDRTQLLRQLSVPSLRPPQHPDEG